MQPSARVLVCFVLIATFGTLCYSDGKFIPMVESSKCMGKTVCGSDEVLNYPDEYIQQLLKEVPPHIAHLLADDVEVHREPPNKYNDLVRRKRSPSSDVDPDDTEGKGRVCEIEKRTIIISVAKNNDNKWRFVVNSPEITQSILVEVCLFPGSACTVGANIIENSTCRQNYIYRKLLALNETGGIEPDNFKIPASCSCYYNKTRHTNLALTDLAN